MISVIIPVYNAEKYIGLCLECLKKQTYKDWECIFVDDCSEDRSLEILEKEKRQQAKSTFVVLHQDYNQGPSAARNKGLEVARGEYICFLDIDDWFDEGLLQAYADAVAEDPWDVVFQGFVREKENGRVGEMPFAMDAHTPQMPKADIICKLYKEHVFGWSWCKMFKREVIEHFKVGFDENMKLWEDELFTIHFLKHASSVRTLSCRHYHYVQYEGSLMNTNNTYLRRLELSEIMNANLRDVANDELWQYVNDTYNKNLKFSMLMALMNKPDHRCSWEKKCDLLKKYYQRCKEFPWLRKHNALRNRISYAIAECILATHSPKLICFIMAKL